MPSVAAVSSLQVVNSSDQHRIASGPGAPRSIISLPTSKGKTCMWCGRTIFKTDFIEQTGVAQLHSVQCV